MAPRTISDKKNPQAVQDLQVRSWLSVVRAYNLCDTLMARELARVGLRTAEHEI